MSITTVKSDAWLAGIEAGCDRLVHPSVGDAYERGRQRRFIGTALTAPFIVAPALMPALAIHLSGPSLLAAICAVFALAWSLAALVAVSGSRQIAEPAAYVAGSAGVAVIIAAGGGIAYPATLLALGLVFEAWWIGRTRQSALVGVGAAGLALVLAMMGSPYFAASVVIASPLAWIAPALYALLVVVRVMPALRSGSAVAVAPSLHELARLCGTGVLSLSSTGEVVEASQDADSAFGLPAGLLAGRSVFERIHVGDRVALMNALAAAASGNAREIVDLRVRVSSDGADRFAPTRLELMHAPQYGAALIAFVRNGGELEELRQRLDEARELSESTEIAKNRFLAAVSHELRTPLNAIIGFSDMMLNGLTGEMSNRQQEYVGLVSSSGHHLLSVVNAILDVSRIESGSYSIVPEPFDVTSALELCRSMMAHQADERGVDLTVSVRPSVRELTADRRAVQQMMINLLSNAIKFTPQGGSVSLDVYRLGDKVSFVIADTGIGIAKDDLTKLGKPFTQVSNDITRRYEGAGLGLSLVKGLVSLHEGEMAIESAPEEGTIVTVTLPLEGPKGAHDDAAPVMPSANVHIMETKVENETVRKTA